MQRLFHLWRDDQIIRACLCRGPRFVSPPLATSPTSSAAIQNTQDTTTATEPTQTGCPRRVPTLSLCDLQALQDTPWGPSMEFCQLACRGRSRSMGTLSTPRDISAGTMSTRTKKTTKMPRKYRVHAKMPKGWAMVEVEDDEVEEVWAKQKKALSDSITPGRLTRLVSRSIHAPNPLSPPGSK